MQKHVFEIIKNKIDFINNHVLAVNYAIADGLAQLGSR